MELFGFTVCVFVWVCVVFSPCHSVSPGLPAVPHVHYEGLTDVVVTHISGVATDLSLYLTCCVGTRVCVCVEGRGGMVLMSSLKLAHCRVFMCVRVFV